MFETEYRKELRRLPVYPDAKDVLKFGGHAAPIIDQCLDYLEDYFGKEFKYISTEEQIDIPIEKSKQPSFYVANKIPPMVLIIYMQTSICIY